MTEPIYFHAAGKNYSVVRCIGCGCRLEAIYDPDIRDTCHTCGGASKIAEEQEKLLTAFGIQTGKDRKQKTKFARLYGRNRW